MCPFERCNWTNKQRDILNTWSALARHSTACESSCHRVILNQRDAFIWTNWVKAWYTLYVLKYGLCTYLLSHKPHCGCQLTLVMLLRVKIELHRQSCTLLSTYCTIKTPQRICCHVAAAAKLFCGLDICCVRNPESNLEPGLQSRPSMEVYLWVIYRSSVHVRTATSGLRQTRLEHVAFNWERSCDGAPADAGQTSFIRTTCASWCLQWLFQWGGKKNPSKTGSWSGMPGLSGDLVFH